MYQNEDFFKNMLDLFANPLFRAGLTEFSAKAQQEGIEAAKKFWGISEYSKAFPYSEEMCERLAEWYKLLGYVPSTKYQAVVDENTTLKAENQLLKNMIREMQFNVLTSGSERAQQAWQEVMDKQMKMNADVANTFLETLRQFKPTT
jgi:regulator of replication initiation timing